MRYVLIAVLAGAAAAVSCTVPPQTPRPEPVIIVPLSPVIEIRSEREEVKKEEPKPPVKPAEKSKRCTGLDTGNPEESAHLKIDCLLNLRR